MHIDWAALAQVSVATVAGTLLVVGVFAMAASARSQADEPSTPAGHGVALRTVGWVGLALAAAFVLYGLYLMIPQLHR